jgi:hypothetical protein
MVASLEFVSDVDLSSRGNGDFIYGGEDEISVGGEGDKVYKRAVFVEDNEIGVMNPCAA